MMYTVLLVDDGGGWVLGVFETLEHARVAVEAFEQSQGCTIAWDWDPLARTDYLTGRTSDDERLIICGYRVGVIDV